MKNKEINQAGSEFGQLETALDNVWKIAKEHHLDPFSTCFEMVPAYIMYELGAYGVPGSFPHWTKGRAYRQMKTEYDYGLSKIYEMVVNSDPSIAYLLETNPPIINIMVMAHVLGHTDFFKNNAAFTPTRRDMSEMAALRADRIRKYEHEEGEDAVEETLDAALAIAEHIDPDPLAMMRLPREEQLRVWREAFRARQTQSGRPRTEYDDLFAAEQRPPEETYVRNRVPLPLDPEKDVLWFIRNFATDLTDWQKDVLDIVREESIYFWPQRRTKIINEGWASFWHKRIMREMSERGQLPEGTDVEWWRLHAGVVAPRKMGLNPYHFGLNMLDYIEERHNGALSDEENRWLEHHGLPVYPRYTGPYKESPGLKKVLELREVESDQSLIRNYLDANAAARMGLYIYGEEENGDDIDYVVVEKKWEQIRTGLAESLNNCGFPYLVVKDGDYKRRHELYLLQIDDSELDIPYLQKTLPYIHRLWGRTVHLETKVEGKRKVYSCNEEGKITVS